MLSFGSPWQRSDHEDSPSISRLRLGRGGDGVWLQKVGSYGLKAGASYSQPSCTASLGPKATEPSNPEMTSLEL